MGKYEDQLTSWLEHKQTMDWVTWGTNTAITAGNMYMEGEKMATQAQLAQEKYAADIAIWGFKSEAEIHKADAIRQIEYERAQVARQLAQLQADTRREEIKAQVEIEQIKSKERIEITAIKERFKESRLNAYLANNAFRRESYNTGRLNW